MTTDALLPETQRPQSSLRILGIVEGDPSTSLSEVPRFLFDALDRRFRVVDRLDYSPRGARRIAIAAATFRPTRSAWRARFHTSRLAHRALSATLRDVTSAGVPEFDVALQVHGWVSGQPQPYVLFLDQTRLMAERGWSEWLPLTRCERYDILRLERNMYSGAFHLFVMGGPVRDSLADDYATDPSKVTVVGGGVNFDDLPTPSGPAKDPIMLFIGRDFERKGGESLIKALELVRHQIAEAELHIVGVDRRFDAPGVVSHGKIADRQHIAALYRGARLFCMPSLYEPWGLVFTEAMAHGLPCIGTTVQSIPEILGSGKAGLLIGPDDPGALSQAALSLLRDDGLAAVLGSAGRRRVEQNFTWNHVVERMAPALHQLSDMGA